METCKAHDCPCGIYQKKLCRYHFDADPKDWGFVTNELKKNVRLLKAIHWSINEGRYKDNEYCREALTRLTGEYPELEPLETDSAMTWAYRAMAWLSRKVSPIKYGDVARKIHFPRVRI